MSIWSDFFGGFGKKASYMGVATHGASSKPAAVEALFEYLKSFVVRPEELSELLSALQATLSKSPEDREAECIRLYFLFEDSLVHSGPPVVTRSVSKSELRSEIVGRIALSDLSPDFRLVFLPEAEQTIELFSLGLPELSRICIENLGIRRFQIVVTQAVADTVLSGLSVSKEGLDVMHILRHKTNIAFSDIHKAFSALYHVSYAEVVSSLGEKYAIDVYRKMYARVFDQYDYTLAGKFLDLFPKKPFQRERYGFLSQEELAKSIEMRTKELEEAKKDSDRKIGQIEAQNKQSEETKKAMLNLLEDARGLEEQLKVEKAGVEKKVEERTHELRQEQAKLTASINSLVAGFMITDQNGAIITKNPASEQILGITHTAVNLGDIEQQLAGVIKFKECHEKSHADKKPVKVKDILLGTKHLELFFAPIFLTGTTGDFLGTVILIQDITEAKVQERSREEFFSIASHELRTPLTAIRGNTSMIQEYFTEELKNIELKEMIDDIHDSSIRLINIVNDFLQTSRLEQGRLAFKNEAFDVAGLIADVLKEYDVTGSRKKLYLKYEPPDTALPQAYADKDRVKQVLINLVGNALKFTEEGGVTVKVYLSEDYIRVVIEDTGRGIPYENQMLLFRKFQQAGNSLFTRDTTKGTGLGLYISKLMVESMGGTIGLQYSRPGKGSAFGFALPVVGSKHAVVTPISAKEAVKPDAIHPPIAPAA